MWVLGIYGRGTAQTQLEPLKTHQPAYLNTFDFSAGGAVLTRATQEGVLLANPSLMAFGPGVFRWVFLRQSVHVGSAAVGVIRSQIKNRGRSMTSEESAALVNKSFSTPIHLGLDTSLGVILSNLGFMAFQASRADIEGRKFGSEGVPELRARASAVGGVVVAAAGQWADWLAVGANVKGLGNGEFLQSLGVGDLQAGTVNLQTVIQQGLQKGYGLGVDAGATVQYRTRHLDGRFAIMGTDLGNTQFKGNVTPWRQSFHLGIGVIVHDSSNALHCSVDYRDFTNVYKEHWTKKTYTGCKMLFFSRIGLGVGLYQGWPTFGVVLNLVLFRLEFGRYTREFGKRVGNNPREVYYVTLATEF